MFRLKLIPREEKYFDLFNEMATHIHASAKLLAQLFNEFDKAEHYAHQIKDLEHQCDELTHAVVKKINQTFITPIDREDIYALSKALDDIIDLIDSAASRTLLYKIAGATDTARRQADVIARATAEITQAVARIKSNTGMQQYFIAIHTLENEGDSLFREAVAQLFQDHQDPLEVIKWKDLYETLERAIDKCEDVANVLESIMLKHA
ncbi:MAG: DUF47 domain-containing protein [Acidobacteria bacterium]|nr:DUF47 domain-containing protein [Acidobacteriota bacterium]